MLGQEYSLVAVVLDRGLEMVITLLISPIFWLLQQQILECNAQKPREQKDTHK